jgi:hypothetical protein
MAAPKTQKVMHLITGGGDALVIIRCRMDPGAPDQFKLYRTYFEFGRWHRHLVETYQTRLEAVHGAYRYLLAVDRT